jgi:hypothetical protein
MTKAILGLAVACAGALYSTTARAENNTTLGDPVVIGGRGYVPVATPDPVAAVQHFSNVLFLNRCAGGCTISPGSDNSSSNDSSILQNTRQLAEFRWSDEVWDGVVACVREVFSPFNVSVTDVDPGAAEHMESMVAGTASQLGFQAGVLGIAPFVCGYEYIPRSISYALANENYYGAGSQTRNINELCSTIAQEVAHTWGLDHEIEPSDPMTYASYDGRKQFQDEEIQCGEYPSPQYHHDCGDLGTFTCPGNLPSTQNSFQRITDRFGPADPTPPTVEILEPGDGDEVQPGFLVRAEADETLSKAELRIDNRLVQTVETPPYDFTASADLGEGNHRVEVRAFDLQGTPGSAFVEVVIGEPCEDDDDCAASGDDMVCVGGRCVLGEGGDGGLGDTCTGDAECYSGLCLSDGTDAYCVEGCELESDDCPSGFGCLGFEGGGVCWPGADGGGGGCASSEGGGAGAALSIGLGLAFAGFVTRRRRGRN